MRVRHDDGSAIVEYAGIVAVIACIVGGLLVLRPVNPGRRAPVRPIPAIARLLQAPITPVVPLPRPRPRRHRPSVRRSPPPTAEVLLPTWLAPGGG